MRRPLVYVSACFAKSPATSCSAAQPAAPTQGQNSRANKTRGQHFKKEKKKKKEIFYFAFILFSTYAIRTEQKRAVKHAELTGEKHDTFRWIQGRLEPRSVHILTSRANVRHLEPRDSS